MKKFILIFPLLTLPFLIDCGNGGGDVPAPTYTVTWKNWDNSILRVDEGLHNGDMPNFGEQVPTRESSYSTYTFSNWSPNVEPINNANQVYVAQYIAEYNCDACLKIDTPNDETEVNLTCEGEVESVDWGDNTELSDASSHTYSLAGEYYIKIIGNVTNVKIDKKEFVETFFVGSTITLIDTYSFQNSEKLKLVEIEEGSQLQTIGSHAFHGCTNLNSFTIPNSVTLISNQAFDGCSSLKSINIPSSVNSIGNYVFNGCSSVELIVVDPDNPNYDSRDNCNAIITKKSRNNDASENELIAGCKNTIIPETVTSIAETAFSGIESLTSIYIPKSVKTVGQNAFAGCAGLTTVVFDDDSPIIEIKRRTFIGCYSLVSINLPKGVKTIGDRAFYACGSLSSITLPDGLEKIDEYAFTDTKKLTFISIPDSVTSIGKNAFYDSGITSIDLPKGINSISDNMFEGADLTSIDIHEGITSIGSGAFNGCAQLTSVTLPRSLTSIGDAAFISCKKLENIEISGEAKLNTVGARAFQNCLSLTSVDIPKGVTSIGANAFAECESLETVFIPSSVVTMGANVFKDCSNLIIFCQAESKPAGWDNNWNSSGCDCYFGYIEHGEEGPYAYICTTNGSTIAKYSGTDPEITIPNKLGNYPVVGIYAKAFYDNDTLVSVTFPDSLETIGDNAFKKCNSLLTINLPNSLKIIGKNAFDWTYSLANINFGNNSQLTTIGNEAFRYAYMVSIDIPDSVTLIGDRGFFNCNKLERVNFGNNSKLEEIQPYAFASCYKLAQINFPNTLTTIGERAFSDCRPLTSITIPGNVKTMGVDAFQGCSKLTSVDFTAFVDPNNLPPGSGSFGGCPSDIVFYVANNDMVEAFEKDPNWSKFVGHFALKV